MSFIAGLFEKRSGTFDSERWYGIGTGFGADASTQAGIPMGPVSSLSYSAVWGCVRNIAEDIGKLPLIVYRRLGDGDRERAENLPVFNILRMSPNPEMGALDFRRTLTSHALLWGNGFAWIQRDALKRPVALYPLRPDRTRVYRRRLGELYYKVTSDTCETVTYEADEILHIRGLSFDGIIGYATAQKAKESWGIMAAAEKFVGSFFGKGSTVGGVLEHPGKLSPEAQKRLRTDWEDMHAGAENANKVAILMEGMKYAATAVNPTDSQLLESRQFSIEEVCRWFRMPPHKVQQLLRATFGNIEHQGLEYVTDCLGAWFVVWEQEIQAKLLQDNKLYAEHLADALMRGDTAGRFDAYNKALTQGWITRDEVRARENMNRIPDGQGKVILVPVNMTTMERVINGTVPQSGTGKTGDTTPEPSPTAPVRALTRVFEEAIGRMIRKESTAARRAAKKPADFTAWRDDFYKDHHATVRDALGPAMDALGELRAGPNYNRQATVHATNQAAESIVNESRSELTAAFAAGASAELEKRINDLCDTWERTRAAKVASSILEAGK